MSVSESFYSRASAASIEGIAEVLYINTYVNTYISEVMYQYIKFL